jgi:hypothetical protein
MKFQPDVFLRLAAREGYVLKNDGGAMIRVLSNKPLTQEWRDAIRMHKQQIICRLPNYEN